MLAELTPAEQQRLREWWKPRWGQLAFSVHFPDKPFIVPGCPFAHEVCLPLLSIGQCIEFLADHTNEQAIGWNDSGCFWHVHIGPKGTGSMFEGFGEMFANLDDGELIRALWDAVKACLKEAGA